MIADELAGRPIGFASEAAGAVVKLWFSGYSQYVEVAVPPPPPDPLAPTGNRRERRAARYTKAGRRDHAARTEHICVHGNWMKTDGTGTPMCPHGCGFAS